MAGKISSDTPIAVDGRTGTDQRPTQKELALRQLEAKRQQIAANWPPAAFAGGSQTDVSPAIYYPSDDPARLYRVYGSLNASNAYSYVPDGGIPYTGPAYEHTLPPSANNDNVETFRANNWIGKAYSAGVNSPSFMALTDAQKQVPALDYNDYIAKKHDLAYDKAQQQLLIDFNKGPGTCLNSLKTYYDSLARSDRDLLNDRRPLAENLERYETDLRRYKADLRQYEADKAAGKNVSPPTKPTMPKMTVPADGLPGERGKQLDAYNSDWSRFIGGLPMEKGIQNTGNAEDAARVAGYQSAIKQATKDGVVDRRLLPDNEYGNDLKRYFERDKNTMDPKLLDAYAAAAFVERGLSTRKDTEPKVVGKALMDKLGQLRQNIATLGGHPEWLPLGRDMKTPGGRPPRQGPVVLGNQEEVNAYYR